MAALCRERRQRCAEMVSAPCLDGGEAGRMPDAGCRMPDAGCRMPDAERLV
ncbi:hypothetical protein [Microbacterium sp. OR16]|uniref:hypothetical protein n=1 Tax=Microbacterium sp. OR16 TaxID=3095345 RepID=UPI0039B627F2